MSHERLPKGLAVLDTIGRVLLRLAAVAYIIRATWSVMDGESGTLSLIAATGLYTYLHVTR